MSNNLFYNLLPVVLILLSTFTGFMLSRKKRPLHKTLFNVHKLVSVVAVAITIYQYIKLFGESAAGDTSLYLWFGGAFMLLLLVTGGLLSNDRPSNNVMKIVHRYLSFLLIITAGFLVASLV